MKKIYTLLFIIFSTLAYSQHLLPEKFDNCHLKSFCLDCGEPKAQPPQNFLNELIARFDSKSLKDIKGNIEIQILVDSLGHPCLLSANNQSNIKSKKLKLQEAINNTSLWQPASQKGKTMHVSVSLLLVFENNGLSMKRRSFDSKNETNGKSVGTPAEKGTNPKDLSHQFIAYTQANSELPWDMSRAIANDLDNNIWIGTDNGVVKIENDNWTILTTQNSPLKPTLYDKNKTTSIRNMAVDKQNNKWFIAGWDVYKYDNKNWTIYDSINSPINWAREIIVDNNNIWFTSWDGLIKFDGSKWSVINTENSELPANKILGAFVDSKKRLWIGTFEGNIMIEGDKTTKFTDVNSPLSKAYISKGYEDKQGNIWFSLYNDKSTDAGMYILKTNGEWEKIKYKNPAMFSENSINDFLLDENNNALWISLNGVGLLKYDIVKKSWEVYTNENSNVPSIHIEQLTLDKNGNLWAATYAGIIQLQSK